MNICKIKNYWEIKTWCYWENELSIINDNEIWINIGFVSPLITNKLNFQKTIALSAYMYNDKFN